MNETAQSVSKPSASGHCLCGGVSYEVHGPVRQVWNCHCWRCRRWTGHFMAGSSCLRSDLRFVSDDTLVWHHPADDPNVAYGFCARCGGSLFWKVMEGSPDQTGSIAICAGTLDQPTGLHTERALFTWDAADYHWLDPSVEAWDRDETMPVAVNEAAPPSPESPPSGHCLCGDVSYVVDGPVFNAWNCHCWRCRRWTGHHTLAVSRCLRSDFRLVSDGTLAWHHPADDPNVAYGFCRNCGSSLFWKVSEGPQYEMESTFICAGTLDAPTGLHTERSVFTDDAADYHNLDPTVEPGLDGQAPPAP